MNPKEKAEDLVLRYSKINARHKDSIKCALIVVDEILENVNYFFNELEKDGLPNKFDDEIEYWNEIKQEIIKL